MVGFSICERHTFCIFQNMSWQSSEYILCSKYSWILNMTGFSICRSYTVFFLCHNMAEYDWINNDWVLNIYHTIHKVRSLSKLMSTYWEMAYSEPGQKSKTALWELFLQKTPSYIFERILNVWNFKYVRALHHANSRSIKPKPKNPYQTARGIQF